MWSLCGSSPPPSCWCCAMIRSNSLMEQDTTRLLHLRAKQNQQASMEKSPNSKSSQKKNSRTGPKQRKNRSTQAKQPTARFLESWFPSISNDLLKVPSAWWNVLAVEECVLSPDRKSTRLNSSHIPLS